MLGRLRRRVGLGMKRRVDLLLVERGLAESRTRAQALLLAGKVYSGERRIDKTGTLIDDAAPLTVREGERYVSRGGIKLEGALQDLQLDVTGLVAVDIGASTGGFTDCLLQHGADRVYAVDVGHGQLADKLRRDPRVIVLERTNARALTRAQFPDIIALAVVDASFIGLDKLLPAIAELLPSGGRLLALVKPQFEVGREHARRYKGVIRDPELRQSAIDAVRAAVERSGFGILGHADSKLAGPKGNREAFLLAVKQPRSS
jgi:23S rRNA (cytidine1920-2'-O)/16S rRNA (cytidine1409-2'-O)-methyltransferase